MKITLLLWPPRRRPNRTGSRTAPKPFVNDSQWLLIEDLFPHRPVSRLGGRPRVPPRECLEGVLWVLKTGARWQDLPERYRRRYRVERSISWLFTLRRLITRWEYYPELFEGFIHLGCLFTILKWF